jgi:glucosamine--fructose-6-phosphate aminotransferase (isomerizing)
MNPATVSDLSLLAKYAAGKLPLEDFWDDFETDNGRISSPIDLLDISFGQAIDELSRPIDAIRDQAKTLTVGTSRKGEILEGIIFNLLRDLNFSAKNLASYNIVTIKRV